MRIGCSCGHADRRSIQVSRRASPASRASGLAAKHQRSQDSPSGPNATARRQPEPGLGDQPLRETHRVLVARDSEEGVHASLRIRRFDAAHHPQPLRDAITFGEQLTTQGLDVGFASLQGDQRGALHELGDAGGVVFDQFPDVLANRGGDHQPPDPPPGHQPGLRKAVCADDPVLGFRRAEQGRRGGRARRVEPQSFVDVVGEDPGAEAAAVIVDRRAIGRRQGPAGRVARRVQQQQPGRRGDRLEESLQVESPLAVDHAQRDPGEPRTEETRDLGQVRPDGGDCDDPIAGLEDRLHRDHQRGHAGTRHRDALRVERPPMQRAQIVRERVAQLRETEVVGVEGFPGLQCGDAGLAEVRRRRFVALAEPESQDVVPAETGVRDLAHLRGGERPHEGARFGRETRVSHGLLLGARRPVGTARRRGVPRDVDAPKDSQTMRRADAQRGSHDAVSAYSDRACSLSFKR